MPPDKIRSVVLDVLRDVQILSGRAWNGLEPDATPIGDLEGFDSLTGIEATVMIEERLGNKDLELQTLFVSENGKQALSIAEITARLSKLLAEGGAGS